MVISQQNNSMRYKSAAMKINKIMENSWKGKKRSKGGGMTMQVLYDRPAFFSLCLLNKMMGGKR